MKQIIPFSLLTFLILSSCNATQERPSHIYAAISVFEHVLEEDVYAKRACGKTWERGQKEAMVDFCYGICDVVNIFMVGSEENGIKPCPDCREKFIILAAIKQIKMDADRCMRRGPAPYEARDEICNALTKRIHRLGEDLGFVPKEQKVERVHGHVDGVNESGYGSKVSDRLKYYIKGKGKGGKLLYGLVKKVILKYMRLHEGKHK